MPSRPIPPLPRAPPPRPPPLITTSSSPLAPAAAPSWPPHRYKPVSSHIVLPSVGAAFSFLLVFTFCFRKISRKRTVSSDSKPPHRFSYSSLRRATNSFSPSLRLGQGGFGSVFRGTLPNGQPLAVKVMDFGSLQGEREFQNELIFASNLDSPYIITALGFSSERKRRRTMLLIYELMPNGNLQDALLRRKAPELADWRKRFSVAVDIARGIEYLHSLDPPVIHGDIKPSNILLDECFSAKISDFGLAWFKTGNNNQNHEDVKVDSEQKNVDLESNSGAPVDDYGSVVEDTESVTTGFEEFNLGVDQSPEGLLRAPVSLTSPETVEAVSASPDTTGVALSPEGISDGANALSGIELVNEGTSGGKGIKNQSGKDWWWKQDKSGGLENGAVKDYVMEWIGTEIKKERPKSDWIGTSSSSTSQPTGKIDKKKNGKRLDWWVSLEEDRDEKILKKAKRRPPREWWKEEYCEELEKKRKRKKKKKEKKHEMVTNTDYNNGGENLWWPRDEELYERKKKRRNNSSKSSMGSLDWFSGELLRGLHNSHDSLSGKTQKSGGISSTPSMRGTVCYVAPEYGGGGNLSEKSDVYSFGVLLLVLVAGRRPLEVTNSPMSELQRANLMHWARNLACAGKLLDLVDQSIQFLDQDQAQLCMTVALLCLQKAPARRPWMKDVVGMLTGELQAPQLPIEFSPSPPSRFPFKSRSVEKVR